MPALSMVRRLVAPLGLLLLSACSTTVVSLPYLGGPPYGAYHPLIAVARVIDSRGEEPNYLGEIRSAFGSPLKYLETPRPVADLVKVDFEQALALRGIWASDPNAVRYDLDVNITRLDGNQVIRREAVAEFTLSLRDHASGNVVYTDTTSILRREADWFAGYGLAGSVPDLQDITVRTLTLAINGALDKPGFVAAVNAVF